MRCVLDNIEAGKLNGEIARREIPARQRVCAIAETLDDELPLAKMASEGDAFGFLRDEPDLYSEADIKQ